MKDDEPQSTGAPNPPALSEPGMSEPEQSPVGYGRPPVSTRFKKGHSGNPQGRPKGSLNVATVLLKTLREKVVINENGKRKVVTKLEASSKQLVNQAASGKMQALRHVFDLVRALEEVERKSPAHTPAATEIDQEVMKGILKRFQNSAQSTTQAQQGEADDAQCK